MLNIISIVKIEILFQSFRNKNLVFHFIVIKRTTILFHYTNFYLGTLHITNELLENNQQI